MKTVFITGANRGIGLGLSRYYLEAGHKLYATARDPECSEFRSLQEEFRGRFVPLQLELTQAETIDALPGQLAGIELDLAINNAGVLPDEALGNWTPAAFDSAMKVNVTGPSLVAQALLPIMKTGSVLANISSGLGSCGLNINPETGLDAYAASKAALNMMTRRLAAKPESEHVTVVAFDPGWVQTRMGGEDAELTVSESVSALTSSIARLTQTDSGMFLSRNGEELPW